MIATIYSNTDILRWYSYLYCPLSHWAIQCETETGIPPRHRWKSITVTVPIFSMCFVCAHSRIHSVVVVVVVVASISGILKIYEKKEEEEIKQQKLFVHSALVCVCACVRAHISLYLYVIYRCLLYCQCFFKWHKIN